MSSNNFHINNSNFNNLNSKNTENKGIDARNNQGKSQSDYIETQGNNINMISNSNNNFARYTKPEESRFLKTSSNIDFSHIINNKDVHDLNDNKIYSNFNNINYFNSNSDANVNMKKNYKSMSHLANNNDFYFNNNTISTNNTINANITNNTYNNLSASNQNISVNNIIIPSNHNIYYGNITNPNYSNIISNEAKNTDSSYFKSNSTLNSNLGFSGNANSNSNINVNNTNNELIKFSNSNNNIMYNNINSINNNNNLMNTNNSDVYTQQTLYKAENINKINNENTNYNMNQSNLGSQVAFQFPPQRNEINYINSNNINSNINTINNSNLINANSYYYNDINKLHLPQYKNINSNITNTNTNENINSNINNNLNILNSFKNNTINNANNNVVYTQQLMGYDQFGQAIYQIIPILTNNVIYNNTINNNSHINSINNITNSTNCNSNNMMQMFNSNNYINCNRNITKEGNCYTNNTVPVTNKNVKMSNLNDDFSGFNLNSEEESILNSNKKISNLSYKPINKRKDSLFNTNNITNNFNNNNNFNNYFNKNQTKNPITDEEFYSSDEELFKKNLLDNLISNSDNEKDILNKNTINSKNANNKSKSNNQDISLSSIHNYKINNPNNNSNSSSNNDNKNKHCDNKNNKHKNKYNKYINENNDVNNNSNKKSNTNNSNKDKIRNKDNNNQDNSFSNISILQESKYIELILKKEKDEFISYIKSKSGSKLVLSMISTIIRVNPQLNLIKELFMKILTSVTEIINCKYAGLILEKLLPYVDDSIDFLLKNQEFTDNFSNYCCGKHSNRNIQSLITIIAGVSYREAMISNLLEDNIFPMTNNQYANFFFNTLISNFSYKNKKFLIDFIENRLVDFSTKSQYGHYLVKNYIKNLQENIVKLENSNNDNNDSNDNNYPSLLELKSHKSLIAKIILKNVKTLIMHKYAHFIIIDIIECFGVDYTKEIIDYYVKNIEAFSKIIYGYAIAKRIFIKFNNNKEFINRFSKNILQNISDFEFAISFNLTRNIMKACISCASSTDINLLISKINQTTIGDDNKLSLFALIKASRKKGVKRNKRVEDVFKVDLRNDDNKKGSDKSC